MEPRIEIHSRRVERKLLGIVIVLAWLYFVPSAMAQRSIEMAFGQEVTSKTLILASRHMELTQALGFNVTRPWLPASDLAMQVDRSRPLSAREWCLLSFEAQARVVDESASVRMAKEMLIVKMGADVLDDVKQRTGATDEELSAALACYLRITQLADQVAATEGKPDETRVQELRKTTGARVLARIGVLNAGSLTSTIPEPTDKQLRDHYNWYRGVNARQSPDGVGYLFTRQVVLDVVSVRVDKIKGDFPVSEQELVAYWNVNNDNFWIADDGERISSDAGHQLERFRNRVIDAIQVERINQRAKPALEAILAELSEPFANVGKDKLGFRVGPSQVRSLEYLASVVKKHASAQRINISVGRTRPIPISELSQVAGLGTASATDHRVRDVRFEHLVKRAVGVTAVPRALEDTFALGFFEPSPKVLANYYDGSERDLFLYRVVDMISDKPASFESIKGKARNDYIKLRAMEKAAQHAEIWAIAARENGLEKAWTSLPLLEETYSARTAPGEAVQFSRRALAPPIVHVASNRILMDPQVPRLPWAKSRFADLCFAQETCLKERSGVDAPGCVVVIDEPTANVVAVVEVLEIRPPTPNPRKDGAIRTMLGEQAKRSFKHDWYLREKIAERAAK